MLKLGNIYEAGNLVEQNYSKAFQAYEKAANLSNPEAQFKLSRMYLLGKGTEKNQSLAILWLTRAADLGFNEAQAALQFSEL